MFGAYVGFKCSYEIIRSNTYSLSDYRKYDTNVTVFIHHKGGYWNCAIRIIRILESLTVSCLLLTLMKQPLDMYTYKVETQQRRRRLATFDIAIYNR